MSITDGFKVVVDGVANNHLAHKQPQYLWKQKKKKTFQVTEIFMVKEPHKQLLLQRLLILQNLPSFSINVFTEIDNILSSTLGFTLEILKYSQQNNDFFF